MKLPAISATIVSASSLFKGSFFEVTGGSPESFTPVQTFSLIPNTPQTDVFVETWAANQDVSGLFGFQNSRASTWMGYPGASIGGNTTSAQLSMEPSDGFSMIEPRSGLAVTNWPFISLASPVAPRSPCRLSILPPCS
ncbi:hypothetical protein B0H19DRAFT_1370023, partial [Mycena capillaripes]